MKVAIATLKRLSLQKKRLLKYKLKQTRIKLPKHFDKKMHTLVYDAVKNEIYESQMHDLRDPNSVIFVKYEQLVQWLLHGAVPNQVKNAIQRFVKINEESNIDNSVAVIEDVHTANNEAIQDHAKNKPMLRNKLKRMKRDELISIANKRSVDLEHTGRLTKQVIMDKIINKMVIDEEF